MGEFPPKKEKFLNSKEIFFSGALLNIVKEVEAHFCQNGGETKRNLPLKIFCARLHITKLNYNFISIFQNYNTKRMKS